MLYSTPRSLHGLVVLLLLLVSAGASLGAIIPHKTVQDLEMRWPWSKKGFKIKAGQLFEFDGMVQVDAKHGDVKYRQRGTNRVVVLNPPTDKKPETMVRVAWLSDTPNTEYWQIGAERLVDDESVTPNYFSLALTARQHLTEGNLRHRYKDGAQVMQKKKPALWMSDHKASQLYDALTASNGLNGAVLALTE